MNNKKTHRGYFVLLVLVFSAVFLTLVSALAGFIFVEKRAQLAKENREKAIHVAEAGLNYYKWFLAHFPNDLQNGTGAPGPYVHTVDDPEGGELGTFSLNITGESFCGEVTEILIESTGWTAQDSTQRRIVSAEYARPSVAEFSHIVDANVWAGDDRIINGPYHSNQGVRMDGTHNAAVSSGVTSWQCTSSFGCSPTQTVDGVFGAGSQPALWNFPTPPVDFGQVTVDLATLEGYAQADGIYLGDSGDYGYYINFLGDGRFTAQVVDTTTSVWEYSSDDGWETVRRVMGTLGAATTYTVPTDCPVIFIEDDVWLEGVVDDKVILAAARIPDTGSRYSVVLDGDLTYADADSGITVIGQDDVLIGLTTPDVMDISGIFVAQNGKFGRNYYSTAYLPGWLDEYALRSTLNTTGTVVSRGRVGTKWTCSGTYCSGYSQRNDSYDVDLALDPPPFTPFTSEDYTFRNWQEVE